MAISISLSSLLSTASAFFLHAKLIFFSEAFSEITVNSFVLLFRETHAYTDTHTHRVHTHSPCLYTRSAGYQKQVSLGPGGDFISMYWMSKWELIVISTHTNRHRISFLKTNWQMLNGRHHTAIYFGNPHQWTALWAAQHDPCRSYSQMYQEICKVT